MKEESDDKQLLALFRDPQTKEQAFNLILKKYQQRVYWHIRRMVVDHDDTDDLVQDVFIKAWKGLENFREDSQLFTWLYRIASNECISFLNKKNRTIRVSWDDVAPVMEAKNMGLDSIDGDELVRKLEQAIQSLPEKQRLVFNMRYYDEIKYEEMSKMLGTSEGALKASYHIAVKKIEEYIRSH